MSKCPCLFFLLVAGLIGCKKAPEASERPASAAPKAVAVDSAAPGDIPPPPAATQEASGAAATATPDPTPPLDTEVGVNMSFINKIIADFYSAEMRAPKDLTELVKGGYAQSLPAAPAGKKFVIDPKTRQVQVVNK